MPEPTSSTSEIRSTGTRLVGFGLVAIVALLSSAVVLLFYNLPDANAFNQRVEDIFATNNDLTTQPQIKFLEILAQSGTAFSDVLSSYHSIIFILVVFAMALLIASLVFLVMLIVLNQRIARIERAGIEVNSLLISREEKTVYLNNIGFKLTDAAMETIAILAEARLDGDILSGAQIEGIISGRDPVDCEEAAGATRIKRLRDTLGNQLISELLVKNIARRGYILSVGKDVIKMI